MISLVIAAILMVLSAKGEDCFFNKRLTYVYDQPDYSGNYTSVKEYWLTKNENCTFIVSTDTKMTWYSSDIDARYLMYWDNNDGAGCRAKEGADMEKYVHDVQIYMGITPKQKENACLVKYEIANNN